MVFLPIDPFPPTPPELQEQFSRDDSILFNRSNAASASLIDVPRFGGFKREVITWRTPNLGLVQMYINPERLDINNKKDIVSVRTKGGFVMHYAGEALTEITLQGTTGSSGIEGINILRSVYRSEQESFQSIARIFENRLTAAQTESVVSNTLDGVTGLLGFSVTPDAAQIGEDFLRIFGQPPPTLASLAANIEMFHQGEVYRGYFTRFDISESVDDLGLFRYTLHFTAYAKQGVRRNFMPWHRQPYNPADTLANPLSFTGVAPTTRNTTIPADAIENTDPLIVQTQRNLSNLTRSNGGSLRYTSSGRDSTGSAI